MLAVLWGVTTVFSIELAGVNRITDTIEGSMGSNREVERAATVMMIEEKPLTGWGFEAPNVGRAAILSEVGSHNGYLETIKFMGYPLGGIFILFLFLSVLTFLPLYKSPDMAVRYHVAIVFSHLVSAVYEGLFVGVHEFSTNIIFYSLAILAVYHYKMKHFEVEELAV
jgi:O-antigen ligase